MPLTPGTKLSHYEVLDSISAGGMGEVYRARDTKLGRDVAIKVLPEEFARNKERLDRFEREARLLAQLNHPNIATLHGLEEHQGQKFLVMELVEGETLAERIAQGPIPFDEAIPLFIQIAEGLEAAHEKGIIHRDLKPANIKIGRDGKPKILDFGLAKAVAREVPDQDLSKLPTMTRGATEAGVLLGTAPYMSPEQARGKPVDKQTDIWAFGCCMYEALTARPAFVGETVSDTVAAILEREPNWSVLPAHLPTILRSLIRRCLQKDTYRRVHDFADARIELEEAMAEPRSPTLVSADASRTGKWGVVLPWLFAMLAGGVAAWSVVRSSVSRPDTLVRLAQTTPPLLLDAHASSVAVSPDGNRMVFVAEQDGRTRLFLRDLGEFEAKPISGTENGSVPFFRPDGQWVGFHAEGKLQKVALAGGPPLPVSDVPGRMRGASWAPDDSIYFSYFAEASGAGVWRVSASGRTLPEPLIRPRVEEQEWMIAYPEVIPGGTEVLFSVLDGSCNTLRVEVMSVETGERRTLIEGGNRAHYAHSGHLVYVEAGSILAAPLDLATLEVSGTPTPLLDGIAMTNCADAHFALSANGTLVYAPGGELRPDLIFAKVSRQGESQPITAIARDYMGPRLSPDGSALVAWTRERNPQVWLYEMERDVLTPLTSEGPNYWPIWSPDGQRVAFPSMRAGGAPNLFLKPADGSGVAERLTTSEQSQQPYSWSPDGKLLVFQQSRDPETGFDVWVLPLEDSRVPRPLLEASFNEFQPAVSPDGDWLAYVSDESGRDEIWLTSFPEPGRKWQVSSDGGLEPAWNPDGRELFYRHDEQLIAVDVVVRPEVRLGKSRVLFQGPYRIGHPWGRGYDVMPDGQGFVMLKPTEQATMRNQINIIINWFEELKRLVPTNN